MSLYGSKLEHAKTLGLLVERRMSGELTDETMLEEMLAFDVQFPGCGWREAAMEFQKRQAEDRQARERLREVRG